MQASENTEIFKVLLRWSKSSRLLQRVALLALIKETNQSGKKLTRKKDVLHLIRYVLKLTFSFYYLVISNILFAYLFLLNCFVFFCNFITRTVSKSFDATKSLNSLVSPLLMATFLTLFVAKPYWSWLNLCFDLKHI